MRGIFGQTGHRSQNSLNAEFGLGDATIIDSLIIEWSSSINQVMTDVAVNQFLEVTEQPCQHDLMCFPSQEVKPTATILTKIIPKTLIRNIGLDDEFNVMVTCGIDTLGNVIYSNTQTIDTVKSLEAEEVVFNTWSSDSAQRSYNVHFYTQLVSDENKSNDTLKTTIEFNNLLDHFELGLDRWLVDTCWVQSNISTHSGEFCIRNTASTSYENNSESSIEFCYSFDLSQLEEAHISLWTKYLIEQDRDFGYLELSTDSGTTWNQVGNPFTGIQAQWTIIGRSLTDFCGPDFDDVRIRFHFVSDSTQPYPMFGWFIDDVAISPHELVASISNHQEQNSPRKYELYANFPNPFNPTTTIRYDLSHPSQVTLIIYNLMGQEITRLVDREKATGSYMVQWNSRDSLGNSVAGGIYICRMVATSRNGKQFTKSRKLVFVK